MFRCCKKLVNVSSVYCKPFSTSSQRCYKVAILGAGSRTGQSLSLLLKSHKLISCMSLYETEEDVSGIGLDLSYVNTKCNVESFSGEGKIRHALFGARVAIITAGKYYEKDMKVQDLFHQNRDIVNKLITSVSTYAPNALILVVTEPVEALVPLASGIMITRGVYDPLKIIGVTTSDIIRASTIAASYSNCDPVSMSVPVIGGHSPDTIVPILSQAVPAVFKDLDEIQTKKIINHICDSCHEVKSRHGNWWSPSAAFAAARLTNSVLLGLAGVRNATEYAFVKSSVAETAFFTCPVMLGKEGVHKYIDIGKLNEQETRMVQDIKPLLEKNIKLGTTVFERRGITNLEHC